MTRVSPFRYPFSPMAGAILSLLALASLAPRAVAGGCAHLVSTRHDPASLASLVGSLMTDLAQRPSPEPPTPLPCAGSWCSGQPASPTTATDAGGQGVETWALGPTIDTMAPFTPSFSTADNCAVRARHQGPSVFNPPRDVSPA